MQPKFVTCGAVVMQYKNVQLPVVQVYLPALLLRVRISSTGCMVFGVPGSSSVGVPGSSMTRIEKQGNQKITKPSSKVFLRLHSHYSREILK